MEQLLVWMMMVVSLFLTAPEGVVIRDDTQATFAEVLRVIDGDTIAVLLDGREERVRYIGVDTPEPYLPVRGTQTGREGTPECFSAEASTYNASLVDQQLVRLVSDIEDVDRYGRLLRYVYVDEIFVNAILLEKGHATRLSIAPNIKYNSYFQKLESQAQAAKVGLWGACQ